jgi:Domain of unknown function (DUF4878)
MHCEQGELNMKNPVVLIILTMLLFSGCSGKLSEGKPSGTYKAYVTALSNGKIDKALSLLNAPSVAAVENAGGTKVMEQIVKDIQKHKGMKSFKTLEERIDGDSAVSKDTVVYSDGFSTTKEMRYQKENGKWKLSLL